MRLLTSLRSLIPDALAGLDIFPPSDGSSVVDRIYFSQFSLSARDDGVDVTGTWVIQGVLSLRVPGIEGLELVIAPIAPDPGESAADFTELAISLEVGPTVRLTLHDFRLELRFPRDLLRPAPELDDGTSKVAIATRGSITIDSTPSVRFQGFRAASLSKCELGESGIYLSADAIGFDDASDSLVLKGVKAQFPDDLPIASLEVVNCSIGPAGFSGEIVAGWELEFDAAQGRLVGKAAGNLFSTDGLFAGLSKVDVAFENNVPTRFEMTGKAILPFFDPQPFNVRFAIGQGGRLLVAVSDLGLEFKKQDLFKVGLSALEFRRSPDETALSITGDLQITPISDLGKIELSGLTVFRRYDKWKVRLEGEKIQIKKSIDLFKLARADILEIGFGERDEWSTVVFSGGVEVIEGAQGGAWVKGLAIPYKTEPSIEIGELTADGIALELVMPDSFAVTGSIQRHEEPGRSFLRGDIALHILPAELEIGAAMMVGRNDECRFAFQSAFVVWPGPGIPIASLPLYLRGLKGLIGANVTPDANGIRDYYALASKDPQGLESPEKWRDECGSVAFGLGVFVATASPKLFSMEALFAFLYPELQLLIAGRAFALEEPTPGKRAPFEALFALDIDEPAALLNIGAKAQFLKGVFDVDGMLEAYYGPDERNPSKTTSYFSIGQVKPYFPVDRPVRGKIIKLFPADSYFIVKGGKWAMGGGIGLDKKYSFSFAKVHLAAQMRMGAEIDWAPLAFRGDGHLKGRVAFRVYGKGIDLSLGADVVGKAPDWYVDGSLSFGIEFKVVVKKVRIGATVPFHWEKRITPPVPELLKEVVLKHGVTQVAATPLTLVGADASLSAAAPDLAAVPDVEPDTYAAIEFAFPTQDVTGLPFGQNVVTVPRRRSGDYQFEALLRGSGSAKGIEMFRRKLCDDGVCDEDWEPFGTDVAQVGNGTTASDAPFLFGAWQAAEAPSGLGFATHLHLFGRSPFEFNRPVRMPHRRSSVMWSSSLSGMGQSSGIAIAAGSPAATAAIGAASSGIAVANGTGFTFVAAVPVFEDSLAPADDLRATGKPLPYYAAQYITNEDPNYPYSGAVVEDDGTVTPRPTETIEVCRNFINTALGYRHPLEVVVLDGGRGAPGGDGEVLLGGYATATVRGRAERLGNCEVAQLSRTHPMRWFEWHCNRGLDRSGKLLVMATEGGVLKIALRDHVHKLVIHFGSAGHARAPERPGCGGKNPVFGVLADCAGDPIAGAAVAIDGTKLVVLTAADGSFCISGEYRAGQKITLRVTVGKSVSWTQTVAAGSGAIWLTKDGGQAREGLQPLTLVGAARKQYSRAEFWRDGRAVSQPALHRRTGTLEIVAAPNASFNEVAFRLSSSVRIYSLCYKVDSSAELAEKDAQLDRFVGLTWPRTGPTQDNSGTDTGGGTTDVGTTGSAAAPWAPGPGFVDTTRFFTPEGSIVPGYLYKLIVRTSHERLGRNPKAPVYKEYSTYFKVSQPPSKLTPYVLDAFPTGNAFPHFRSEPLYLRMGRNYVHKLVRGFENTIHCRFRRDGSDVGSELPFRDGQDADLSRFDLDTRAERRGWGWGKTGDGHALAREESVWLAAYNQSVPQEDHVTEDMAIPDDVLWAYAASPVLLRAQFDEPPGADGSIAPFEAPLTESGESAPGRWSTTEARLLRHQDIPSTTVVTADDETYSYLLSFPTPFTADLGVSVWIRPEQDSGDAGLMIAVESTDVEVHAKYVRVDLHVADGRIVLSQKLPGQQAVRKADKPFPLPSGHWSKVHARVAMLNGKVTVTVHRGDEVVFAEGTELTSAQGRVGLYASRGFVGSFDNFEVLSMDRLRQLPAAGMPHSLLVKRNEATLHEQSFTSSRFLDLFDLLNAWDRTVWRASAAAADPAPEAARWVSADSAMRTGFGELRQMESRYTIGNATLEDVEGIRRVLRNARYELDEAFSALATILGFELSARPGGFQFVVSNDGRGVLFELPEPLDWTRHGTGPIAEAIAGGASTQPAIYYSSDFTRGILLLGTVGGMPDRFVAGSAYTWSIRQYTAIPDHLSWLRGWLEPRAREFTVTFEIPETAAIGQE